MANPKECLNSIAARLMGDEKLREQVQGTFKFVLDGPSGGVWRLVSGSSVEIKDGEGESDCDIAMTSDDFVAMCEGRSNGQMLFISNKLRVGGDLTRALQLSTVLQS